MSVGQFDVSTIKISDNDLNEFWDNLNASYNQTFNIEDQDIGD